MSRIAVHTKLGSVHLDKDDLSKLESIVWNHSAAGTLRIVLSSEAGSDTFSSVKGIEVTERLTKKDLKAYEITVNTSEGHLSITGDGLEGDYHYLTIEGDSEWVDGLRDDILSFYNSRKNWGRSLFRGEVLEISTIIAAVLLGTVTPRFLPSLMLHIPLTWLDVIYFVVISTVLFSLVFRSKTYPYVKISLDKESSYQFDDAAVVKYVLWSILIVAILTIGGGILDPTRGCLIFPC